MKSTLAALVMAALVSSAGVAPAGETGPGRRVVKHSGTVVGMDLRGRWVRVEEMGPWRGPGTGAIEHLIVLTPQTRARLLGRPAGTRSAVPLDPLELWPGDFVTVVTRPTGAGASVAVWLDVIRP
jgi:hypothetical protein